MWVRVPLQSFKLQNWRFAPTSSKEFLDRQGTIECDLLWNAYVTWQEHVKNIVKRFFKPKIKEIRRNIYEIENKSYLSTQEIKENEENRIELENNLSRLKKYYDYDDIEYKGIRDIGNSFNLSIDEDYYKPIRTIRVFENKINYIDIKVKEKDKILSVKYLDMIRPYLSDIINDHKTEEKWKVHSGNTVIDYKTQGE